jgi:hypothetical protein
MRTSKDLSIDFLRAFNSTMSAKKLATCSEG